MLKRNYLGLTFVVFLMACSHTVPEPGQEDFRSPKEIHFENLRQLTHGGTNAEAYWSWDSDSLTFQHQGTGFVGENPECDQIYTMKKDGSQVRKISGGKGRTTCSFFLPKNQRILFSTTYPTFNQCPPQPDRSKGYVWPLYPSYKIFSAKTDGTDLIPAEPAGPTAYNAETAVCHDGSVVFTSDRSGDLELYRARVDSLGVFQDIRQITFNSGYDGGAMFSPDCKQIVWRASRPRSGKEMTEYRQLLSQHLVKPSKLEIWIADAEGKHARQLTRLGAESFAPAFTPDGKKIIFSSNFESSRIFHLYLIDTQGTHLEKITYDGSFNGFPMFSPNGKWLAFSSNRNAKNPHEMNVFVTEWKDAHPITVVSQEDQFLNLVADLSSPQMEGRGIGTAGLKVAEERVAKTFQSMGLRPFWKATEFKIPIGFKEIHNVVGTWGSACGKSSPIVIGAHLDHLGFGSDGSLEPNQKGLHPGADDNASGVAAMIEVARMIQAAGPNGCFIFAAFAGEESGILGSSHLAKTLEEAKIHPKAMLNLDMVGRMENNVIMAYGSDSAKEWQKILDDECKKTKLDCRGGGDGYGPSDHMAFFIKKVPVLHFFTGAHLDYHRTSDTSEKINATGGIQVAELVAAVSLQTAKSSQKLQFRKSTAAPTMGTLAQKGKTSHGAYLGTIPDYSTLASPHGPAGGGEEKGGVRLAGTRTGSPAEKAGIRDGDVLKSIKGFQIRTLQEFTDVLFQLHPGEEVQIGVERGGKPLQLMVTVGKRE